MAEKKEKQYVSDNAQLMTEWNWEKNIELEIEPNKITFGSTKQVWWICDVGHEWEATPNNRSTGRGCPYCANRKILKGFNDLSTLFPNIASEWSETKNKPLSPDMVFPHSKGKYWWICPVCQVEYIASVAHRVNGTGCPQCASRHRSSFAEQAIYYYIRKSYPDAIHRYTEIFNDQMELDIYIPSLKTGIEYDGGFWHKSDRSYIREQRKYKYCQELGIQLIRVREEKSANDDLICDFFIESKTYRNKLSRLNIVIQKLSEIISMQSDIDVIRDEAEIKNQYYTALKEQSLLLKKPKLALEWDYQKNKNLRPDMVSVASADVIWWKCSKGHSWKSAIYNRNKGAGCPYCSGTKVTPGENDLQSLHPKLMMEWDYSKNKETAPETLSPGSSMRVWWICNNRHSWQTSIYNRATKNTGCPYCLNNLVWTGYNDLQTLYPQLALEWNYEKNSNLNPKDVTGGSTKKVWWRCSVGHEWEAQIRARVRGNGCPMCKGINNSTRLKMPTEIFISKVQKKNRTINITSDYINSKCKVNCQCVVCGNEWSAYPSNLLKGHGCSICARNKRKKSTEAR